MSVLLASCTCRPRYRTCDSWDNFRAFYIKRFFVTPVHTWWTRVGTPTGTDISLLSYYHNCTQIKLQVLYGITPWLSASLIVLPVDSVNIKLATIKRYILDSPRANQVETKRIRGPRLEIPAKRWITHPVEYIRLILVRLIICPRCKYIISSIMFVFGWSVRFNEHIFRWQ